MRTIIIILLSLMLSLPADAKEEEAVSVGVYLNNIPQISLKEKKFQVDFYLWFRWRGEGPDPLESFEIVNGHVESKEGVIKKEVNGVRYSSARIVATIYRNFTLNRYPLDDQVLKIQIEDSGAAPVELPYVADKVHSAVNNKIDVPGWRLDGFESYTSVTKYPSAFGDPAAGLKRESVAPRYTFSVSLKRAGYGNFIKLFSILFLAAGLAFCAFRIPPDYIDARIAFAASAVFMAVLTQSALSNNLPESDSFGMADQLYNVTMGFIAASFVVLVQAFRAANAEQMERAKAISRKAGWILPPLYVAAVLVVVISA